MMPKTQVIFCWLGIAYATRLQSSGDHHVAAAANAVTAKPQDGEEIKEVKHKDKLAVNKVQQYLDEIKAHGANHTEVRRIFGRLRGEGHATQEATIFELSMHFEYPLTEDRNFQAVGQEVLKEELTRAGAGWSGLARSYMAKALGDIGHSGSAGALVEALKDNDPLCRMEAASALLQVPRSLKQVEGLVRALAVDCGLGFRRFFLAEALGKSRDFLGEEKFNKELLPVFRELRRSDENEKIRNLAKKILASAGVTSWKAFSAGRLHTCGITEEGELRCWGDDDDGQCRVPKGAGPWIAVAAGGRHSCGITAAGTLLCWGWKDVGCIDVPKGVGPWKFVAAGYSFTCGITTDGKLHCFGEDWEGQCSRPPAVDGPWRSVSLGYHHACGVAADGKLRCWGYVSGQEASVPAVAGPWKAYSAGGYTQTCGIPADGDLHCWGPHSLWKGMPKGKGPWRTVAAGYYHTCGVNAEGALFCWGDGENVNDAGPWSAIDAGWYHTCGIRFDGELYCWGTNGRKAKHIPA